MQVRRGISSAEYSTEIDYRTPSLRRTVIGPHNLSIHNNFLHKHLLTSRMLSEFIVPAFLGLRPAHRSGPGLHPDCGLKKTECLWQTLLFHHDCDLSVMTIRWTAGPTCRKPMAVSLRSLPGRVDRMCCGSRRTRRRGRRPAAGKSPHQGQLLRRIAQRPAISHLIRRILAGCSPCGQPANSTAVPCPQSDARN